MDTDSEQEGGEISTWVDLLSVLYWVRNSAGSAQEEREISTWVYLVLLSAEFAMILVILTPLIDNMKTLRSKS